MRVTVVGILGGIGSGKSAVVRAVTKVRLKIIDADRIAHALLDNPEVLGQLKQSFDPAVFGDDGRVVRSRLAQIVFGNTSEHSESLKVLERILHPVIGREIENQIQSVPEDTEAVVIDAALLLEAGRADRCDSLIFVETPVSQREARVLENRGWCADELHRREAAQLPVDDKRRRADHVVDNSGSIEQAAAQMTAILRRMIS